MEIIYIKFHSNLPGPKKSTEVTWYQGMEK